MKGLRSVHCEKIDVNLNWALQKNHFALGTEIAWHIQPTS